MKTLDIQTHRENLKNKTLTNQRKTNIPINYDKLNGCFQKDTKTKMTALPRNQGTSASTEALAGQVRR